MDKKSFVYVLIIAVLLVLWLSPLGLNDQRPLVEPTYKTAIPEAETKSNAFEKDFPNQYRTYLQNNEDTVMTEYKGSVKFHKNDNVNPLPTGYKYAQPYLKNLWLGYPFSFEYNETRGHTYALTDILEIDRINRYAEQAGLPATCWNCKTTRMPGWVAKYGDEFWAKDFNEFRTEPDAKHETIGCPTCHDPQTMKLRITSVPLDNALKARGQDWRQASRNEMRSLVCGQCHVEYYFTDKKHGPDKKPVFPWTNGFCPADMYAYYKGHGSTTATGFEGQFADWTHPVSDTPMLKAQHPEYETWIDGPHGAAGVACADCHMAYVRSDDKKKISSHWWTSPLKDLNRSCRTCHADKTEDYLKSRVLFTQKRAFEQLLTAQRISVKAHEAVRLARAWQGEKPADYEALLIQAKENLRKGQFFWDLVSAENSVGFHNPTKTLDTLATSQQCSQRAVDLAMQATGYAIAPALAGEVEQLVPPILEHSRKLQQSEEHLRTHPWLAILKPFPKAERYWDFQTRTNAGAAKP